LVGGGQQINLFEDSEEIIRLYQAMDKMRQRFGTDKIGRAVAMGIRTKQFNPFKG
jgi:DNA polymerase-4